MSFVHVLVILSAVISIFGSSAYVWDTVKGKTKPNRVSWSLWALAPIIATFAALSVRADVWATTRVFLAGFMPLLIFIASFFNKKSFWKITFFDAVCGVFSFLALIVWWLMGSAQYAILLAVIADGFASLPTMVKGWKYPETETGLTFVLGFIAVLLVIPSIPVWNIQNSAFQIYLLIVNAFLVFSIYGKKFLFANKK